MVTFPFNTTDFTFTHKLAPIVFTSQLDSYFDATITIKYFDFYDDTEKTIIIENKIPLFNGTAKWFVGDIIERNIPKLKSGFQSGFQQNTTKASFLIEEKLLADDTVDNTTTLNDVLFVPGPSPQKIENNVALLHSNAKICRAFNDSRILVSFLLSNGNHTITVYQNDTAIVTENITATASKNSYTFLFDVSNYTVKSSDIIKFQVNDTEIFKEFVIYPPTPNQNNIWYANAYNVMSSISFSGEFNFPNEFDKLTHTYRSTENQIDEIEEIVEVLEYNSLKINTGFILQNQIGLITELMKSNSVIAENIIGLSLEMTPQNKKNVGFDSTNFLYEYDLEFRINKSADA
tara:strand:- start:33571 stop:34611 length:1041 start_codon:yes stop_codon:yes gene_type:complete